jgi:sigma-B regulation protein RsbU (phosphoserine phosphatase)
MRYRWKILTLLMLISILPIIGLRTFGIHNVHRMADALAAQLQESELKDARGRMYQWMDGFLQTIEIKRQQVEMALAQQAMELRRSLGPENHVETTANDGAGFVAIEQQLTTGSAATEPNGIASNETLCVVYPGSASHPESRQDAMRLGASHPIFHAVDLHLGSLSLRHYSGLANGAAVIYPCDRNLQRRVEDPRKAVWYRNAFTEKPSLWSASYIDPQSGKHVMAASLPLERENEEIYGVTSIIVPVETLLEVSTRIGDLPAEARVFLTRLAPNPAVGSTGLKILFETGAFGSEPSFAPAVSWLSTPDEARMDQMLRDIAARRTDLVRMPFEGRDSFWGYGPLVRQGTAFVLVVPADRIIAPSQQLRSSLESRVERVENYTMAFLFFLIAINTVLALLFSRTVTRPLHSLVDASRELAAGNFASRVEIDRSDEFGDLERVFNQLGPRLKDHFRMQQALNVAMEIQQTLLPLEPPRIDGLDIHAVTRYSDKTGGDFFDYLCVGEGGRQRLCVAVGDVSDHGIPSALLMATARALLRYRADAAGSVGKIVTDVNAKFSDDVESSGRFITLFLARIDRVHPRIEWVRAGHDPALLYDPETDAFQSLQGNGIPLGVESGYRYGESACGARPGQILFIGTDGIWETRNREDTFFGKDRLCEVIRRHADAPAAHITRAIIDSVVQYRGSEPQEDDLTAVVVKFESVRSQP